MSAGAVKALCRCAALPGGGRVASAAVMALADAAQDGAAAVQVGQIKPEHVPAWPRAACPQCSSEREVSSVCEREAILYACTQMLHERLLVTLADLALSPRVSEAGLAFACFASLMQHPGRLAAGGATVVCSNGSSSAASSTSVDGTAGGTGSSPQQLCVEMGRACDAASTTVLLDLVAGDVGGSSDTGDWRELGMRSRVRIVDMVA